MYIFLDGFEMYPFGPAGSTSTSVKVNNEILARWNGAANMPDPAGTSDDGLQIIAGRYGGQALRMYSDVGSDDSTEAYITAFLDGPIRSGVIGFALRQHTNLGNTGSNIRNIANFGPYILESHSSGLRVYKNTTNIAGFTSHFVSGQWYYTELAIIKNYNGSNDYYECRVDGNVQISGETTGAGVDTPNFIRLNCPGGDVGAGVDFIDFDDVYVRDIAGLTTANREDWFIGDGRIGYLKPSGDGYLNTGAPVGVSASGNYAAVIQWNDGAYLHITGIMHYDFFPYNRTNFNNYEPLAVSHKVGYINLAGNYPLLYAGHRISSQNYIADYPIYPSSTTASVRVIKEQVFNKDFTGASWTQAKLTDNEIIISGYFVGGGGDGPADVPMDAPP